MFGDCGQVVKCVSVDRYKRAEITSRGVITFYDKYTKEMITRYVLTVTGLKNFYPDAPKQLIRETKKFYTEFHAIMDAMGI